jgi:alkylation response protein AidB-like acyl-CoA dehydrogenase
MQGSTATYTLYNGAARRCTSVLLPRAARRENRRLRHHRAELGLGCRVPAHARGKVEGGLRPEGSKIFTTHGTVADLHHRGGRPIRHAAWKGLDLFVVDTRTAVSGRAGSKFTIHCSDTAELVFDNCSSRSAGWETTPAAASQRLQAHGGPGVHRRARCGQRQAAYDAALRYAKERVQFGQPIGKFQAVQFKLVDMLATLEQTRLYTYYAAGRADRGEPITTEAALAKLVAADGCNEVCQKALNIFGGYGLMNEFPVQRFLRDSYFPIIGGGTSDIMRLIVARQIGL